MRRTFSIAFLAFFLLGAAWALALPVNGTYDEKQHIVRAWSVYTGQWVPHQRAVDSSGYPSEAFDAPGSLLPANPDCTWYPKTEPAKPASCQRAADPGETVLASGAARYDPLYYLAVGAPIRISPDQTGVIGSRLLSAALSALLLAAAATIAQRSGNRLLLAAVVVVGTPLAMNLNGSINPNGLEISAGVLLFASLLTLVRAPDTPRRLLVPAGIAGALLLVVRNFGPVLFALALLACVVAAPPGRVRALLRDRAARLWLGTLTGAGLAFAVFWTLASRATDIAPVASRARDWGPGRIIQEIVTTRGEFYVRQIVAQFNYGETTVSLAMIGAWYLLVAALVVPALWLGDRRLRFTIVGIGLACVALLVGLELYFIPKVGLFSHGRYIMPLGVGVVLAAAFADRYTQLLAERGWLDRLVLVLVAATVPLDLYALARVMTRFQRGIEAGLNPFGGSWQPEVGSAAPLLICLVGGALLVVIVTRSSVRPTPEHSTVNTLSN